jgi:hypothetical protein
MPARLGHHVCLGARVGTREELGHRFNVAASGAAMSPATVMAGGGGQLSCSDARGKKEGKGFIGA